MIDALANLMTAVADAISLAGERLAVNANDAVSCDWTDLGATTGLTTFINAALMPFIDEAGNMIANIGIVIEELADAMTELA